MPFRLGPTLGLAFALLPAVCAQEPVFRTLHLFDPGHGDGADPAAGMTLRDGRLYGTTYYGGASDAGTVFELTASGVSGGAAKERVLYSFTGTGGDGAGPSAGVIFGVHGEMYGTTYNGGSGYGTVFEITPPSAAGESWTETVLYRFASGRDGAFTNGIALSGNGTIYGTTAYGGIAAA